MREVIRALVREKLRDGRLPLDSIHRLYGGPADGEMCDACDEPIPRQQVIIEGITSTLRNKQGIQFHQMLRDLEYREASTDGVSF
jgi:hypothetical protein